jgi:hypothetical protein
MRPMPLSTGRAETAPGMLGRPRAPGILAGGVPSYILRTHDDRKKEGGDSDTSNFRTHLGVIAIALTVSRVP